MSLRILGRRDDGYHELESEFVSVNLYDTLSVSPAADGDSLSVTGPCAEGVPTDRRNLVWTVIDDWRARSGDGQPWRVDLFKRIPSQAGLGGGSSDAAAALWAVNQLAGCPLPPSELDAIAAAAGSDLNFFLTGTPRAICRGRGEQIERLPHRLRHAVIAKPDFGLPTGPVFQALPQTQPIAENVNDLQVAADVVSPAFQAWRQELSRRTGRTWHLTGSGACVATWGKNFPICRNIARQVRSMGYHSVTAVSTAGPIVVPYVSTPCFDAERPPVDISPSD